MIRQGTTPQHTFTIPFDVSLAKEIMIIYAQNDVEVFRKTTEDCAIERNTISVTLKQEDAFKLDHKQNVQIQARILTMDGNALASDVKVVSVGKCLNSEVMA